MKHLLAALVAYNNENLPTVIVQTANGPVMINKSDYDANPENYVLQDAIPQAPPRENTTIPTGDDAGKNAPPAGNDGDKPKVSLVPIKDGKKYFVANSATGEKVENVAGIDNAEGYKTDADAWNAILALNPKA